MKSQIEWQIDEEEDDLRFSIKDASGEHSSNPFHLADVGTDTMEREKRFWRASVDRDLLNDVLYAIEKIENGEYGICEDCGNTINHQRLEALPHARLCLECKASEEKRNF